MRNDGECFCGAVQLRVKGRPAAMGYCHCISCRSWSASPVNAFTLWRPADVMITRGADELGCYHRSEMSYRKFCRICGGHVLAEHPTIGLLDVYAATIPGFRFRPTMHCYYAERVLSIPDRLPKYTDYPAEFGGSGRIVDEALQLAV